MEDEREQKKKEMAEYLAGMRKRIAESERLVSEANLRIAETDRFLAANGLTREQVLNFRFTPAQRLAVNEELARRGLPPIEDDDTFGDFDAATAAIADEGAPASGADELEERRRKFGAMMQTYRI